MTYQEKYQILYDFISNSSGVTSENFDIRLSPINADRYSECELCSIYADCGEMYYETRHRHLNDSVSCNDYYADDIEFLYKTVILSQKVDHNLF